MRTPSLRTCDILGTVLITGDIAAQDLRFPDSHGACVLVGKADGKLETSR